MKYNKIVLVFPGQNSQYEGMGKALYDNFEIVRGVYIQANKILGYKKLTIEDICFKGHRLSSFYEPTFVTARSFDEAVSKFTKNRWRPHIDRTIKKLAQRVARPILHQTKYTQPAMFTTSYAFYKALEERCNQEVIELKPFAVIGHSLGEYPALVVSGAMDFSTALRLVQKRAVYMAEASRSLDGELRVIFEPDKDKELDYEQLKNIAHEYGAYIALINSPRNIVVGGSKKSLDGLSIRLRREGKKVMALDLEGPFHTEMMIPSAINFENELRKRGSNGYLYKINHPTIKLIANVTANYISEPEAIRQELTLQIYSPVNFRGSVEKPLQEGADLFIEIGPGKVLSGLIRDINPQAKILNVEDTKSLEETVGELKG